MSQNILNNIDRYLSIDVSLNDIIEYIKLNNIIIGMDIIRILTKHNRNDFITYLKNNRDEFRYKFTQNFFLFL